MAEQQKEVPQYELTERAYIDDVLHEPGAKIHYKGVPGHHMQPLNAAAKQMCKDHGKPYVDPIEAMTIVA